MCQYSSYELVCVKLLSSAFLLESFYLRRSSASGWGWVGLGWGLVRLGWIWVGWGWVGWSLRPVLSSFLGQVPSLDLGQVQVLVQVQVPVGWAEVVSGEVGGVLGRLGRGRLVLTSALVF